MSLKKAGIGIDPYKLDIFKEELIKEGYKYKVGELTKNVLMLFIEFEEKEFNKVEKLIRRINLKAKANKDKN